MQFTKLRLTGFKSFVDATELEAFVDGLMEAYLDAFHIAGGVVSVVKDGELVFAKGYGQADVEADTDVDPDKTLFRIGSLMSRPGRLGKASRHPEAK